MPHDELELSAAARQARELLRQTAQAVDAVLLDFLPPVCPYAGELDQAMRHLLAGGKRLRPLVVQQAARTWGLPAEAVSPTACALELLHTATLIHDDLPCIDDADQRRGRPAVHVVYGEPCALLAGDALIVAAFGAVARQAQNPRTPPPRVVAVLGELAEAVGAAGVIGGEAADILGEGRPPEAERLAHIHHCKTARLFEAAARSGALLAGAQAAQVELIGRYAQRLGLLFQVTDDLLDATGEAARLGKPAGADAAAGKQTYPALLGIEASRQYARELGDQCLELAARLPAGGEVWRGLVGLVLDRET